MVVIDIVSSEAVTLVHLKYCVDLVWMESLIGFEFLEDIISYDFLTDNRLRTYLDSKAKESKDNTTLDRLDSAVSTELEINMSDSSARSRIENLIVSYHSLCADMVCLGSSQTTRRSPHITSSRPLVLSPVGLVLSLIWNLLIMTYERNFENF